MFERVFLEIFSKFAFCTFHSLCWKFEVLYQELLGFGVRDMMTFVYASFSKVHNAHNSFQVDFWELLY